MKNNVLIKIKTVQDSDPDAIELETPGKFGILNKKYYIIYEESPMTGFADTTTTIKVWPGNVEVSRRGKFNMTLRYQAGHRNLCLYPTPYGEVGAAIFTSSVDYAFTPEGGRLTVDYTLDADNTNFMKNTLNVAVRPAGKPPAHTSAKKG